MIDPKGNYYDPRIAYILNFWDYYIAHVSIYLHLYVMYSGMNYWCGGSKIMMGYTA